MLKLKSAAFLTGILRIHQNFQNSAFIFPQWGFFKNSDDIGSADKHQLFLSAKAKTVEVEEFRLDIQSEMQLTLSYDMIKLNRWLVIGYLFISTQYTKQLDGLGQLGNIHVLRKRVFGISDPPPPLLSSNVSIWHDPP